MSFNRGAMQIKTVTHSFDGWRLVLGGFHLYPSLFLDSFHLHSGSGQLSANQFHLRRFRKKRY